MKYLVFDTETTGLYSSVHDLIQIGGVLLDEDLNELSSYMSYVKPLNIKTASKEAMAINKISLDTLKDAPTLRDVLTEFRNIHTPREDIILVGHNVGFDIGFLKKAHERTGLVYDFHYAAVDTMNMAMMTNLLNKTNFKKFKLETICNHFKISYDGAHDALADAKMTAQALREFKKLLGGIKAKK